jgi:spore germination protein KC/spore germination protein
MVLAKGRAVDLLKEQPRLERFSGEAIRELVKSGAIPVTLRDLLHEIDSPGIDPFLPVFQARPPQQRGKSGEIQVVGIGLFQREKLISIHAKGGVKGGDVGKTLFWFHHRFNPIVYELVSRDGARFSFIVHEGRTKIRPVLQNGKIHFHIRLEGLAILVENLSDWNFNDKRWVDRLNREVNAMIAQDTRRLIELIKTSKTDTMGLGLNFARHYPKEWKERYRDRWDEVLPGIICEVTTKIKFSNVGQTTKNIMEEK